MGKAITIFILLVSFYGCNKTDNNNCPSKPITPINQQFLEWVKLYPMDNAIIYFKFKSNKGQEESLRINRELNYGTWSLEENCKSSNNQGETKDFYLRSTLYGRCFEISIGQISQSDTKLSITNLTLANTVGYYISDYSSVRFNDVSINITDKSCDTCFTFLNNTIINNKTYDQVIRVHCPNGAQAKYSSGVKEILVAKSFGVIQYSCTDSTIWNIEY